MGLEFASKRACSRWLLCACETDREVKKAFGPRDPGGMPWAQMIGVQAEKRGRSVWPSAFRKAT